MSTETASPVPPSLSLQLAALQVEADAAAEKFVALATAAIKRSEPLVAFDVTTVGLARFPDHTRLLQKRVESMIRAGSIEPARQILEALRRKGDDDEETLGFFGRVDKEVWWVNRDSPAAGRYLKLAFDAYQHAYHRTRGYWTGINAATLACCAGEQSTANALAAEVQATCQPLLAGAVDLRNRYYLQATLGEAALVQGDCGQAEDWYRQATESAGRNYGDIASTRRNARMLLRHRGLDLTLANNWLHIPRVIVFSGHMIDALDRPTPRFPAQWVDTVAAQIKSRLSAGGGVSYAFASAASGSDLLFLRAALQAGGDLHVVLPFGHEEFAKSSVEPAGEPWLRWFSELLSTGGRASERVRVTELSSKPSMNRTRDYEYANQILYGLARVRSLELATDLSAMAVWNQQPGDGAGGDGAVGKGAVGKGVGGTGSAVSFWRSHGLEPEIIDLNGMAGSNDIVIPSQTTNPSAASAAAWRAAPAAASQESPPTQIAAMLFADAKGFSKLPDDQMLPFVEQYLGLLKQVIDQHNTQPLLLNTWGDGLYMVFESVSEAGEFALRLCDALESARQSKKLTLDLRLRIGLHAGPVYKCHNPATNRPDVMGTHVTRTARLEPVTPPGQVYASEAFAALAYAEHVEAFRCDYVGPTPLDKSYGTVRAYHVRRWRTAERDAG